jgi:galactitol PTS system EIIA component
MIVNTLSVSEDLVKIGIEAEDQFSCIEQLGDLLFRMGYVKDTYIQAAKDREKVYPTGLPTNGVGVAIPHTDAVHVIKPAVAIGTLKNPVKFNMMGDIEQVVEVQLIFMLAINDPSTQVQMLQELMSLFGKEEMLKTIQKLEDPKEIIALIEKELAAI